MDAEKELDDEHKAEAAPSEQAWWCDRMQERQEKYCEKMAYGDTTFSSQSTRSKEIPADYMNTRNVESGL